MEKLAERKVTGTVSLEEALERFASRSKENRDVLNVSLKMKELMDQIVEQRENLEMTQRDLAEVSGIKQPMIARIERLESIPRFDTFLRIADNLDFEVMLAYKVDFSPLNLGIKKIKYVSASTDEGIYKNNQISYGGRCVNNEQIPNAA